MFHRDIKPENILLDRGVIRLCDFGLTCLDGTVCSSHSPGTRPYIAPESIQGPHVVSSAQDVWSLGIVLYAIIFADLPWEAAVGSDVRYAKYLHTCSVPKAEALSPAMAALLTSMLAPSPDARATAKHVAAFFSSPPAWFAGGGVARKRSSK